MPPVAEIRGDAAAPLALYVHLPWCVRKCPYCDFNSYERNADLPDQAYVDALLRDLDSELPLVGERSVPSVYIGGGTPSLFSGAAIRRLLAGVRDRVGLAADAEVSLEANPGAAEVARFAEFRDAGVNRLSIGVQSFRDAQLAKLGRVHDAADAARAIDAARRAGFDNVNLDLMYALPGDDLAGAIGDLESAIARAPAHISWYQLTLEPNTAFARRPPRLPDDELTAEIEQIGRPLLARHGYARYEVSAYGQPARQCRHNLNYWQFGDYLGLGAGAHGKVTLPEHIERRTKTRNPRTYMDAAGTPSATVTERIDSRQIVIEFLMNALRLPAGVPFADFERRTGQPRATIDLPLRRAIDRGWIMDRGDKLQPTDSGLQMLNSVLEMFV
jgi:putative oxygen-independent coproporphyrinogen III oxidase